MALLSIRYLFAAFLLLTATASEGQERPMAPAPVDRPYQPHQRLPGEFRQNRLGIIDPSPDVISLSALPKDDYGFVDWAQAMRDGVISPKDSIIEGMVPHDNGSSIQDIIIKSKLKFMPDVLFPHSAHTVWLKCNNCHPKIFKQKAGANAITMVGIWKGQYCGRCHDKVAFPTRNCFKCHSVPRETAK